MIPINQPTTYRRAASSEGSILAEETVRSGVAPGLSIRTEVWIALLRRLDVAFLNLHFGKTFPVKHMCSPMWQTMWGAQKG